MQQQSRTVPAVSAPRIEVPRGGGAIRGIGEKFGANPVTGTGTLTVPIDVTPARSGNQPELTLEYNSGAGNGPFGFGWTLSLPHVSRKTDRGLPRYCDDDVFVLSGVEDLVLVLNGDGSTFEDRASQPDYVIHRYRPRIDGLLARIERWTRRADGDVHWRSYSKDNVLTVYGPDARSRIADPADGGRVFTWLVAETRDDKGNVVIYDYKAEDGAGINLADAHERNRGALDDPRRTVHRYIKSIRYGNRMSGLDQSGKRPFFLTDAWKSEQAGWMFEVVFDYGEHDASNPRPSDSGDWSLRPDPFSTYRATFEIRTTRRCRRVLMFHHFPTEPDVGPDCLVRSIDLRYADELAATQPGAPIYSFVRVVTQSGYRRQGDTYVKSSLPPLELEYTEPVVQDVVHEVDARSLENVPVGLDGATYQWTDLHGDGLPGLLTEQAGAWYYKRNLSPAHDGTVTFAPMEAVALKPNVRTTEASAQLLDLAADGQPDLVLLDGPTPGLYEHDSAEGWQRFRPFASPLAHDPADPNLRLLDLDGDGLADALITEDDVFVWHASLGENGFGPARRVRQPMDQEARPRLIFSEPSMTISLADMTGDGLTDLVRIRDGEVCYWPNLGYGRFGARVTMDRSPHFDSPDTFRQDRIRLADIDGSGTTDIIYLGSDRVTLYFNQSGNNWSDGRPLAAFPRVDDHTAIQAVDLLGNGTACLVWSSPLPTHAVRPMRYVDLMGGCKPHLLVRSVDNLGGETSLEFTPSTRFAIGDKLAGAPWPTRLPFPVHVLTRVEKIDRVTGNRFVTRTAYHDGYFDGVEREFRGFGRVEQWDKEEFGTSDVPPVLSRTWFHTGASNESACVLPGGLNADELREANRALKGAMLRREVYALDGSPRESAPYHVTQQSFAARLLQPRGANQFAVFLTHPLSTLESHYERNPADPRTINGFTLSVDDFGNILQSASIAYGRTQPDSALSSADQQRQAESFITIRDDAYTNAIDTPADWRIPLPAESQTFELGGLDPVGLTAEQLTTAFESAESIDPAMSFSDGRLQKRVTAHVRTLYRSDALGAELLPTGALEPLAVPGESYQLTLTRQMVADQFGDRLGDDLLEEAGYVHNQTDLEWWAPSGRTYYSDNVADEVQTAREHFFQPVRFRDPFGNDTLIAYDAYDLKVVAHTDPLGNLTSAQHDYRVVKPTLVTDMNGNRTAIAFDALGLVVGTACMGKDGVAEGDSLDGFVADLDPATVVAHIDDPLSDPDAILGTATTRCVYGMSEYLRTRDDPQPRPVVAYTLSRETHVSDLVGVAQSRIQHRLAYGDCFGRVLQQKIQAPADDPQGTPRWIGTGWTVFDDKGRPVRTYEPFFSDSHLFEGARVEGVATRVFYDPLGRNVASLRPDHTFDKLAIDAWRQSTWDANDTVLVADPREDADTGNYFQRLPAEEYLPTWYAARADGTLGTFEQRAARNAAVHANTPSTAHLDALGRTFLSIAHKRFQRSDGSAGEAFLDTRVMFDIQGNHRQVFDALSRLIARHDYDLLGQRTHTASMDAGEQWSLYDVGGKATCQWDAASRRLRTIHDALGRPTETYLQIGSDAETLVARTVYGEDLADARSRNLRGRAWQSFDGAGLLTSDAYDFKGNLSSSTRQFCVEYTAQPDWTTDVALGQAFTTTTTFDALNRLLVQTQPDRSATRQAYDEAGVARSLDVLLDGIWQPVITSVQCNARGERERTVFGNGVVVTCQHDPSTFRVSRLTASRGGDVLQDLTYTYDPVGNPIHVADAAQQTLYFRNARIEPGSDLVYDSIYQLVEATGREHLGQAGPPDPFDSLAIGLPQPGDGAAMGSYIERYTYDAVGNILEMQHVRADPSQPGWTRTYQYAQPSLLESSRTGNRLTATSVADGEREAYAHDAHGNVIRMPHLSLLQWNVFNQLQATARQVVGSGTPESTYYLYHTSGRRVRKVTERSAPPGQTSTRKTERLYVGNYEVYVEYAGDGANTSLQRHTLHLDHVDQRIALVESRTVGDDGSPGQLLRYQVPNLLGSSCLELDATGRVISYEEYFPFGGTSYQAVDASIRAAAKRYRFSGQERDEESGLEYHAARYYAPWLGRWCSPDPARTADGPNLYWYVSNRPTNLVDPHGTYGVAGHYYTVLYTSLAVGMDPTTALRNAFFSYLPDMMSDSEAIFQEFLTIATFKVPGTDIGADRVTLRNEFDEGFHALTGRPSKDERANRALALSNQMPGSLGFGLAAHAFGDSYSHSQLSYADWIRFAADRGEFNPQLHEKYFPKDPNQYPRGRGHGLSFTWPDDIARRPDLYRSYTDALYESFAAKSSTPLVDKATYQGVMARVAAAPDANAQIKILADASRDLLGFEPTYAPEQFAGSLGEDIVEPLTGWDFKDIQSWAQFENSPGWSPYVNTGGITLDEIHEYAYQWRMQRWQYSGPQ